MYKSLWNTILITMCLFYNQLTLAKPLVEVQHQNKTFYFDQPPHLKKVLDKLTNKGNIYWPSAALFQLQINAFKKNKLSLFKNLSALISETKIPSDINSIQHLQKQIENWQLGKRLAIQIDYDLARTVKAHNPLLTEGRYILIADTRPKRIEIFGAIKEGTNQIIPHRNQTFAADYIQRDWLSPMADLDRVTLIQADGRVETIPMTTWNKKRIEIMPGSQIFVPFRQTLLGPDVSLINQQLISIAVNRVI